jgi:hypothetical protein
MRVEAEPLVFNALSGGGHQIKYIFIYNDGGGILDWVATVTYKNGKDWVRLDPPSGRGGMRLDVLPLALTPGLYEATLTIDAGPIAGTKSLPVSMRVGSPPAPVTPARAERSKPERGSGCSGFPGAHRRVSVLRRKPAGDHGEYDGESAGPQ